MGQKTRKLVELPRNQRLRARAAFCRLLAVGAGDPGFAKKLHALAEEYETEAARAESRVDGAACTENRPAADNGQRPAQLLYGQG